jgi:hypothetical protein
VIGCAALLVPVLGGKEGGLLVSPRPLHYGISPCLHSCYISVGTVLQSRSTILMRLRLHNTQLVLEYNHQCIFGTMSGIILFFSKILVPISPLGTYFLFTKNFIFFEFLPVNLFWLSETGDLFGADSFLILYR